MEGWKVVRVIILLCRAKVAAATIVNVSFVDLFPYHVIIACFIYGLFATIMFLWCEFVSLLMCFIEFLYMLIANV